MMTERQKEIMTMLREWLEEYLGETTLEEGEEISFLRIVPPLFENGEGRVYMEICLIDYSEEVMIAQVYSTMLPKPGPGMDALREKLGQWNLESLAGSYGIYEKLGQLYHKQMVALINEAAADDQTETLFTGICMAMDEMARRLPEAVEIANTAPPEA